MANCHILEGPWGDFTFHMVRPENYDKVIKHLQDNFLRDEPMSKLLGYTDEFGKEFEILAKIFFEDNLSFWAEHNETGDVAAVRMTFRHEKDSHKYDHVPMNSRGLKYLWQMGDMSSNRMDLYEYYGVDAYADFGAASCAPKYRKRGLASEMYRRSLKYLKAEGYKMAKSAFTSPYTRQAAINLGFKEMCRLYFHEMRDETGKPLFDKNVLTDDHFSAVLCKPLV